MPDEGQSLLALAEQRRKQVAEQLNRVCSALEAKKVSIHPVLRGTEERPGEICGQTLGDEFVANYEALFSRPPLMPETVEGSSLSAVVDAARLQSGPHRQM